MVPSSAQSELRDGGTPAGEYRAAREEVALFDRSHRGRLVLTGSDRKGWLHNLVTNSIMSLEENQGGYAFAADLKGRILFDMNVLCFSDALWLEVEARFAADLAAHLDRYKFTEDVHIEDASDNDARMGVTGPRTVELAATIGVSGLADWPPLTHAELPNGGRLIRHDFAGLTGFELIVPRAEREAWWERLIAAGARPAGFEVLDVLRIEAGIPWLGRDLDAEVLPPETGPAVRGVSWNKGCYVGHEVLERMRSRGALARTLVRVTATNGSGVKVPSALQQGDQTVGRLTSLVQHPARPEWIGLAYLKTGVQDRTSLHVGGVPVTVCETSGT